MKKAINSVTFLLLVFIFFLSLSSAFSAAIGGLFYYSAYVVPVILAMLYFKASEKDEIRPTALRIMPDKKSALFSIPFVFPFVAIVLLISFLTSLVLNTLGFSYATDVSGNIFAVITKHVLLPAFLEEAVFRFIPLALIAPYSKKNAVVISSVFFAVVHCNLFQIPYALFAGLVLSYVALATGSIFPAVALHFLNNLSSVILMRNDSLAFSIAFKVEASQG